MKPLIVIFFLVLSNFLKAQIGIYITASDFVAQRLTHCSNSTIVRTHELIKKDIISVKVSDSVYSYQKSEIYGFRNKNGIYRLYKNKIYTVLNPSEKILLYKITIGTGLKNSPIEERYYLSKDAAAEIWPLSLYTVLELFSKEEKFELLIELYFKNDEELLFYDSFHNKYKLNRLYELSKTLN